MSEKSAAPVSSLFRRLGQRALASGGGAALGGAGGASVGAVAGGLRGYQKAEEEGRSGLSGALSGGLRGAAAGGALGAGVGGVAGAAGGARAQRLVRSASSKKNPVGSVSRFGERQVHSLTGALPQGMSKSKGLRAIGASPEATASEALMEAISASKAPARLGRLDAVGADKKVQSLTKALEHAKKTEELGMTSLPGAARAFATHPVQATKAGLGREWHSNPSVGGKLMAVGLPAGMVVSDAMRKDDPESTAASRGLASAGMMAPFSLTPMGFAGATVASGVLGGAGKRVGGLLQRKKPLGRNTEAPVPEDASESGNVEHELSPRASGEFSQ